MGGKVAETQTPFTLLQNTVASTGLWSCYVRKKVCRFKTMSWISWYFPAKRATDVMNLVPLEQTLPVKLQFTPELHQPPDKLKWSAPDRNPRRNTQSIVYAVSLHQVSHAVFKDVRPHTRKSTNGMPELLHVNSGQIHLPRLIEGAYYLHRTTWQHSWGWG